MMIAKNIEGLLEFNFNDITSYGLFVCAGGFEDRATAFPKKLRKSKCSFERSILLKYESHKNINDPNFQYLNYRLKELLGNYPDTISVHADEPNKSYKNIVDKIQEISLKLSNRTALIDISGMSHLWAIETIHACLSSGIHTTVIYTEAKWYFPMKRDEKKIVRAWRNKDYDICEKFLQSASLKNINIIPEFYGNFRPGHQTCLIIFVGFEPNRVEGLVDDYAPARLIVLYGKSPYEEFGWRTKLSKDLHFELFSRWYVHETEISTLKIEETLGKLEDEFSLIREHYDVAIAPIGSKMQTLAVYLFWRRHPEVQLVFTTPVKFNPNSYSRKSRRTFVYRI